MAAGSEQPDAPRTVVCLIAGRTMLEGAAGSLRYLQVALPDEGVDVVIVVPEHRRVTALEIGPTTLVTYPEASWILRRWARHRLVRDVSARLDALRDESPVVIHALDATVLPQACELATATGAELTVTLSSTHGWDNAEFLAGLRQAAMVVTPSEGLAARLEKVAASTLRQRTIGFGAIVSETSAAFSPSNRSRTIVYVGPLRSARAGEVLLRAAKQAAQHAPNLLVFVVGKGAAEGHWRQVADGLGIRSQVIFTGNIDNWQSAVHSADIFCLPSATHDVREEPVQALADGLAVVAAEGSMYDCFQHEQNALIFHQEDEDGLALAFRRLLTEPGLARRLGAAGQVHAREKHSVGAMVNAHVQLYEAITEHRRTLPLSTGR